MTAPAASPHLPARPSVLDLSRRQRTCLTLAAQGLTSIDIGRHLGISGRTVDEHLMLACHALGVRTRVQAAARLTAAMRAG